MKQLNSLKFSALALTLALAVAGCASKVNKADISSSANPKEEIAKMETDLKEAQSRDVDVLAFNDYDKSIKSLEEAKSDLASGQKQEEIIDDLRMSRGYLNSAIKKSEGRRSQATALLDDRQMALKAGAASHPELKSAWSKIDREVIKNADDFSKVDTEDMTEMQSRYVELERQATVITELGDAKARINGAKNDRAEKRAPKTLKTAELSVANAESIISTNVRNPAGTVAAVAKANSDAKMLTDVMEKIKTSSTKNLAEASAISMVMQTRQISDLKDDVTLQQSQTELAKSDTRAKNQELMAKDRELNQSEQALDRTRAVIGVQQALEKARSGFTQSEAEAYQQGENLVIRLKTMSFPSGGANLPPEALPILAKVADVARDLGAAKIRVEGHTDSTGDRSKNQTLSETRARAVASYFKLNGLEDADVSSEGYGLSKPLGTNKTAAGRAQNRRVDVVITPGPTNVQ